MKLVQQQRRRQRRTVQQRAAGNNGKTTALLSIFRIFGQKLSILAISPKNGILGVRGVDLLTIYYLKFLILNFESEKLAMLLTFQNFNFCNSFLNSFLKEEIFKQFFES